ncbi:hypothetical protein TNCV_3195311 [Trichonephila clavipes]|uniref:Peptidase S1 domain-containing protein n=1 Tax=Trichonephila clavipes TaxID=2585209 RepID=A0A8X6R951_TRICX|nr:hypothetical protein TNCV_3195311 [Trichonephila clavipes]
MFQEVINESKYRNNTLTKPPRRNDKFSRDFQDALQPRSSRILQKFLEKKNTEDSNEIPDEIDPKIVNGRPANEGEFPWMVALHFNDRFICSSFLISPTIVMTAAHCVKL